MQLRLLTFIKSSYGRRLATVTAFLIWQRSPHNPDSAESGKSDADAGMKQKLTSSKVQAKVGLSADDLTPLEELICAKLVALGTNPCEFRPIAMMNENQHRLFGR